MSERLIHKLMKYTRIFLLAIFSCSLSFCSSIKDGKSSIKQGVFGRVLWMQGNFMPSPDRPQRKESTPALRTVYIYKLTKLSQTEGESPLFSKISTVLVAKVKTNIEGYFQCKLAPGKYSIFTLEYRFILEQNSYLYVFGDGAWYENNNVKNYVTDTPIGFGAGISFETKAGIFSINYALGKQFDNPIQLRSGKIHFGIVNYF